MTHYQLISQNKQRSLIIMILFVLFVGAASWVMAEGFGYDLSIVGLVLIFSGITSFSSYWWSDKLILSISGAREVTREEYFDFYTIAENLAHSRHLPVPKLYVIDDTAMNAFATGRDPEHAVICCTTGILARLERPELEGVIAHELSHIENYDIRLMAVVTVLVGFLALFSDMLLRSRLYGRKDRDSSGEGQVRVLLMIAAVLMAALSPLIAKLIQLAISRKREYLADANGVAITKNPEGLARALEKLSMDTEPLEAANKATAHLYITNPLKNTNVSFAKFFMTHPPIQERIQILRNMGTGGSQL
ncbi:MAG: M48 family metallopeptidase [Pseudomonadales bacterium]|nr:M48 family metallopeptidase [Pseudomonadales bacterium]